MLRTVDLTGITGNYRTLLPRGQFTIDEAIKSVLPICESVAAEGIEALKKYSKQFDGIVPSSFKVDADIMRCCADDLDPKLAKAFDIAISRRRQVCETLETEPAWRDLQLATDAEISQAIIPVSRVGLYVPGGLAPLPSSLIMNVIPAQVAGVNQIAVASPPQKEFGGLPHPSILALCHILNISEVYAVGGAQAIAMFAHGVEGLCEPVNLITGPGNIYVAAAKRAMLGLVGIDSEAGPTEIAILADSSSNPSYLAADLISQAEHDPMASAILVTPDVTLINSVKDELALQISRLASKERIYQALTGEQSAFVLVRDLAQGISVVNAYAAEHLEIQTENAQKVARSIRNAGAIFIGSYSPVSLGDYCAGSTHVLPTGAASCHSSGLNVRSFMRAVHIINYGRSGLLDIATPIETFANAENLPGHAAAINIRRTE